MIEVAGWVSNRPREVSIFSVW